MRWSASVLGLCAVAVADTEEVVEAEDAEKLLSTLENLADTVAPEPTALDALTEEAEKSEKEPSDIEKMNGDIAFVGEVYDGRTFSIRTGSGSSKDNRRVKVIRIGNVAYPEKVELDKARRALDKKIGRQIVVIKEAPEQHQPFTEEQRNATTGYINHVEAGTPGLDIDQWTNLTLADVWTFDGWHVAKTLSDKYPHLFEMNPTYNNSEHVPADYHILSAASQKKKEESMAKLHKAMEEYQTELKQKNKDARTKRAEERKAERAARGEAEPEPYVASSRGDVFFGLERVRISGFNLVQIGGFGMAFAFLVGAFFNFGRTRGKWKGKPTKAYILKEQKAL